MAILAKSKFAGFLRGLMGRADDRASTRPAAPSTASAPAPASPPPPKPAAPVFTPNPSNPDQIELPLASVLTNLPMDLRAKLMAAPQTNQTIQLQAEMVISQLAFGAVKISFGELRTLVPGVFVNSGGELDGKLISLPLQEILPRLNPALLARRAAKKVEVADEIVGPFAERGRGFTFTTQPLKAPTPPAPAPAPEPAPVPVAPMPASAPIAFVPPAALRQTSPPAAPQIPNRLVTPGPTNGNGNGHHPLANAPLPTRSITPAPVSGNGNGNGNGNHGNGNGNGKSNGLTLPLGLRLGSMNGNSRADIPAPIKMSAPSLSAASQPALPRPAPSLPAIFVSLGDLCESWPEELKGEIGHSSLAQASVALDGAIILPGLKRGRVVMTWKQLRILAQPSSSPSPSDNLELELPLKVIAPLFLAAQKNPSRPQSQVSVSSEIPDLFFGFPTSAAAPITPPVIPPLPKAAEPKQQDTNYYVWGEKGEAPQADEATLRRGEMPQTDFMTRQTHPKDVVVRATALPGVAGSVVAMQDGLCVASQTPPELNPDTLAAFLPQIFERVNQSTRELRMGTLNNVSFTVGNVPWKIFRVNAVYFAAFGAAGGQLPSGQLAQLAAELDRKKQQ